MSDTKNLPCLHCPICDEGLLTLHGTDGYNLYAECSICNGQIVTPDLMRIREQIRKLRDALEFYADEENYLKFGIQKLDGLVQIDSGKRAREALKNE